MQELSPKEVEAAITEFGRKIERLRISYDQYFMGISKREPSVQLKDVVRLLYLIEGQSIRNTGHRFRFRTSVQKFNTLRTQWNRTLRRIEAGTYQRDVKRARKRIGVGGSARPMRLNVADLEREAREVAEGKSSDAATSGKTPAKPAPTEIRGATASSMAANAAGAPPAASEDFGPIQLGHSAPAPTAPTAPAAAATNLSAEKAASLHRRFVKAKKMCGEDAGTLKMESLRASIEKQLPGLRKKHPGKEIDFEVVIRSGRAVLKAVAK